MEVDVEPSHSPGRMSTGHLAHTPPSSEKDNKGWRVFSFPLSLSDSSCPVTESGYLSVCGGPRKPPQIKTIYTLFMVIIHRYVDDKSTQRKLTAISQFVADCVQPNVAEGTKQ